MEDKLNELSRRYNDLEIELSKPDVIADKTRFKVLTKEHSYISPIIVKYEEMKKLKMELSDTKDLIQKESDMEMINLLKTEIFKETVN